MTCEVARWNPARELAVLLGRPLANGESIGWVPAVDVVETDKEYLIQADLPGVEKDSLKVTVDNGVLTFSGERQPVRAEKQAIHAIERNYGKFARSFELPEEVEADSINAQLENGLFSLRLPKTEKAQPRSIQVEVK